MKYILDYFDDNCDYAFYVNANAIFNETTNINLNYDMNFVMHTGYNDNSKYKEYNDNQIEGSESFIDYGKLPNGIKYCQSGFFGGKPNYLKQFCKDICQMLEIDLAKGIIPTWHDESYLNKWLYCNYWLVENKPNYNINAFEDIVDLEYKGIQINNFFKHKSF